MLCIRKTPSNTYLPVLIDTEQINCFSLQLSKVSLICLFYFFYLVALFKKIPQNKHKKPQTPTGTSSLFTNRIHYSSCYDMIVYVLRRRDPQYFLFPNYGLLTSLSLSMLLGIHSTLISVKERPDSS